MLKKITGQMVKTLNSKHWRLERERAKMMKKKN